MQAYLPLDDTQRTLYARMIEGESFSGVKLMNKTVYDQGLEQGRRLGRLELLEAMLESKFSPLPPGLIDRVCQLPDERLRQLALALPTATSLADLGV